MQNNKSLKDSRELSGLLRFENDWTEKTAIGRASEKHVEWIWDEKVLNFTKHTILTD